MASPLDRLAVRVVKPVLPQSAWRRLRAAAGRTDPAPAPVPQPTRAERLAAMDLTTLGRHFGTDKATTHHFTQHYERHLAHLKDEEFVLLEIGIGGATREGKGGKSLRMWKRYFPRARIVGLDIEDKSFVEAPRIVTYQGDQSDEALLRRIVEEQGVPRVVIDDGSHRSEHVRATFAVLFPLLADGGVYAIEDTQTSYWPSWGGSLDRHDPATTMSLVKDLLDGLNHEEFLDEGYEPSYTDLHVRAVHCYHNLVVLEKGLNLEGTRRDRISGGA